MQSGPMALETFDFLIALCVAKVVKVSGLLRGKQCAVYVTILVFLLDMWRTIDAYCTLNMSPIPWADLMPMLSMGEGEG